MLNTPIFHTLLCNFGVPSFPVAEPRTNAIFLVSVIGLDFIYRRIDFPALDGGGALYEFIELVLKEIVNLLTATAKPGEDFADFRPADNPLKFIVQILAEFTDAGIVAWGEVIVYTPGIGLFHVVDTGVFVVT